MTRALLPISVLLVTLMAFASPQLTRGTRQDNNLEITFQPRAIYPYKGRKKEIEGEVVLQITLKADGTVGEIVNKTRKDRRRLEKYGFVENAITAAKKIRFNPRIKNGEPVSTLVTRVYTFSIY